MSTHVNRRAALGLGAGVTAGFLMNASPAGATPSPAGATPLPAAAAPVPAAPAAPATPDQAARRVAASYRREARRAAGTWQAYATVAGAGAPAVVADPDRVVEAYSVNKIAVATAVLDKVDRGLLALDRRVDVTAEIVVPGGDGIFSLDGAYPSAVTLGHVLAALLTVSDDTAVRLCGLVAPAAEINEILVAKGFPHTQVEPVANPNRFFLGTSTARETHALLTALVGGTLLSPSSTDALLSRLRAPIAFTDGIRREMSSAERARVATKAGWFDAARHEAGVMFDAAGAPVLTYVLFSDGAPDPDNFGATHPAVAARAAMGRDFLDAVDRLAGDPAVPLSRSRAYRPSNGG